MKAPTTQLRTCVALAVTAATLVVIGCASDVADEPSYADLVVIYNAEAETLERLKKQKQELIANHEAQLRPSTVDTVQAITDAFTSASDLTREVDPNAGLDPNAALDQAVENAQNAQDAVSQLLNSVTEQPAAESEEDAAQREKITAEFEQQLAALDEEIKQQEQRVERARQDRDAAESNR